MKFVYPDLVFTKPKDIIPRLQKGEIGVVPTDTIYGLVGSALKPAAVSKIYRVKKRAASRPFIVLISSVSDLSLFNIKLTSRLKKFLKLVWPGEVSVILPCPDSRFSYLHRNKKTLAFRLPADKAVRKLVRQTGPLAAPSANPFRQPPAKNVSQAMAYFGCQVDFYLDGGTIKNKLPSILIELKRY